MNKYQERHFMNFIFNFNFNFSLVLSLVSGNFCHGITDVDRTQETM